MDTGNNSRLDAVRGRGRIKADLAARKCHKQREACFLDAWKRGVRCAGIQYFEIRSRHFLELAVHRDQLRPSHRAIKRALSGDLNAAEGLFLCALYSVYNEDEGGQLARHFYPDYRSQEQILQLFDRERRSILEMLMKNYSEW